MVATAGPATAARAASPAESVALPLARPPSPTTPPPGFSTDALQAIAIARRLPQVRAAYRKNPDLKAVALVWNGSRWEVDFNRKGISQVEVDVGPRGELVAVWTGIKARVYFARGKFGGHFDAPIVWLTFSLLFLAPLFDPRRPLRMLHVDLVALLAFGLSFAFFNRGHVDVSVLLIYPVLLYLLARMLWLGGRRARAPAGALVPFASTGLLLVGVIALTIARVGLNVTSDKVIDVGYASVVGADRVAHGQQLYVDNDIHGDTYGPLNYVAYMPFEALFPWKGVWDDVPAAHAASIVFDLLTLALLIWLGMRVRPGPEGRRLGLALAWGWAAYPFTLFGVMQNTNDGLIALLLVASLLVLTTPAARGALLGVAGAAKFFPAALLPLYLRRGKEGRTAWLLTAVTAAVIVAGTILAFLPPGGLREFWNCTLGYQLGRPADFSLWGIYSGIGWTRTALEIAAAAIVVLVAFFPRGPRSLTQIAALGAAVLVAIQIPAGHWFYFYLMWFTPFVLVALFGRQPVSVES